MLSTTFKNDLDPQYSEMLLKIEESIKLAETLNIQNEEDEKELQILQEVVADFLSRFMMPSELWDKTYDLIRSFAFNLAENEFIKRSVYQFYYGNPNIGFSTASERKIYDYHNICRLATGIEDICFPHKLLDMKFDWFAKYHTLSLIPKSILRIHEKMKVYYDKIKMSEGNDEEWFKLLLEVGDEEFVEHNVEYQLGKDLTNKKLWKMYLEYLKSQNQQNLLLQTYSKYCRFFLEDTVMKEEYRNAAVGNVKVAVPWKNPYDFEVFDETFFDNLEQGFKITPSNFVEKPPLQYHFSTKNAKTQIFPFKSNLMYYITQNADAYLFCNLQKSCKWFYLTNPVTFCYKFESDYHQSNEIQIKEQSIFVPRNASFPAFIQKIYISTHLSLISLLFSSFASKIYRCTAKYVSITKQKLSEEELQILIGHGNVVDLHFWQVKNSNNEYLILENVLKMVPKIKRFEIICVRCTSETAQTLCSLPFENKIRNIMITDFEDTFLEPNAFAEFIIKNISPKGGVLLEFSYFDERNDFAENFEEIFKASIDEKWKDEDKPSVKINILS